MDTHVTNAPASSAHRCSRASDSGTASGIDHAAEPDPDIYRYSFNTQPVADSEGNSYENLRSPSDQTAPVIRPWRENRPMYGTWLRTGRYSMASSKRALTGPSLLLV